MKALKSLILLGVSFSLISQAQLVETVDLSDEELLPLPVELEECYHGTVDNLFEELYAYVNPTQQCPVLLHDGLRQHDPKDPNCRLTRIPEPVLM